MTRSGRTVLITGCSDGGMGAALALAFHAAGLRVIATARDVKKMSSLADKPDIRLLPLDITSTASIKECLSRIDRLDILVNNAGGLHNMPLADADLDAFRQLFELNVWGQLAMVQACTPLLVRPNGHRAMIVNHTTIGVHVPLPFQSAYNASKAALAMFSDTMRLELAAFDVDVVQLKTGGVATNIVSNTRAGAGASLPATSIYAPAADEVQSILGMDWVGSGSVDPARWAREVVGDLLGKRPPPNIWRGHQAFLGRLSSVMPFGLFDGTIRQTTGLDKVEAKIRAHRGARGR